MPIENSWDECECGHEREEHGPDGCDAIASSGVTCACPSFKKYDDDD